MKQITAQLQDKTFRFSAPEDWKVHETPLSDRVNMYLRGPLAPDGSFHASISVRVSPRRLPCLATFATHVSTTRATMPRFRLLAHARTNLADLEAVQLDLAHEMPLSLDSARPSMFAIQERIILAVDDTFEYELCYRAAQIDFEAHLPVFQALVDSWRLLDIDTNSC